MATIQVVQGFSQLNRTLMYLSALLAPAQAVSGIGHTGLSNLGFLAYNWYTQVIWYRAASQQQFSALSLVAIHANTTLALAYLGAVFSRSRPITVLLTLGTLGVLWLNNATAWAAWKYGQDAGYGHWQFFFFGWRTLSPGWHKFITIWQVSNSLETLVLSFACVIIAARAFANDEQENRRTLSWWYRVPAIPVGGAVMMLMVFPYVMWIELIVRRNRIESDTDWVAVYVFIAQVALIFLPDFGATWRFIRGKL